MNGNRFPELRKVHGQVSLRGGNIRMTEHLGNDGNRTASLKQCGRETGAQTMRVVPGPGHSAARQPDALESGAKRECSPGVSVHDFPHASTVSQRVAVHTEPHRVAFSGSQRGAAIKVRVHQTVSLRADRHVPAMTALASGNVHGSIRKDITHAKRSKLTGPQASFVQQPDHQMIAQAGVCSRIRRSQDQADLTIGVEAHQARRHLSIAGNLPAFVCRADSEQAHGGVEPPQRLEFTIDRGRRQAGAARTQPSRQAVCLQVPGKPTKGQPAAHRGRIHAPGSPRPTGGRKETIEQRQGVVSFIAKLGRNRRVLTITMGFHTFGQIRGRKSERKALVSLVI